MSKIADTGDDTQTDLADRASPFELARSIWRRRWLVLVVVVLTTGIAVVLAERQPDEYQGTASLLFREPDFASALGGADVFTSGADPERNAQTNVDVVASRAVADVARARLRTREPAQSLLDSISVSPDTDSDLATVTATRSSATDAARVANAFADAYIEYRAQTDRRTIARARAQLEQQLGLATGAQADAIATNVRRLQLLETLQTGNAEVIARAGVNDVPTAPHPRRDAILGFIVGLLVACVLALLADVLDKRLRSRDDVEAAYSGLSLIGEIPEDRAAGQAARATGASAEAYRVMREGVRFLDPDGDVRCVLITSADPGEGKSTVARNLAAAFAEGGQRTVLVEADMRRPTMSTAFGLEPGVEGFSDLLVQRQATRIRVHRPPGIDLPLSLLPSGPVPPNAADLLRSAKLPKAIDRLTGLFDVVVIDSPPIEPIADTRILLGVDAVDVVLVVARVGVTRRDRVRQTRRVLRQSGNPVVGLVVVGPSDRSQSSYYAVEPTSGRRAARGPVSERPATTG